jgi:hypothetical protein
MTALTTEPAGIARRAADRRETDEVFHVERRVGRTGQRVELARYTTGDGNERVLYGQRVDGVVRVTDVPECGPGRAYLVERGLEQDGYDAVKALVADYLQQAELLADVPMAVSPVKRNAVAFVDGVSRRPSEES